MSRHLYPDSTYKYNSGGNPEDILELSHQELVNFHKKHYHPSNATFFTFGDMKPDDIQQVIAKNVFQNFEPSLEKIEVKKPSFYQVLIMNDDYTPMEFVILVLEKFFKKSRTEATQIMLHVHQKGMGVCGLYPYEVAETKVVQVMDYARKNEHPLQCAMEKE